MKLPKIKTKLKSKEDTLTIERYEEHTKLQREIGLDTVVEFLHTQLDKYGDDRVSINKAINYAFSSETGKGGFLLIAKLGDSLAGAAVINDTGMKGYIPEHILVYIAVDKAVRGLGIGKKLLKKMMKLCNGDIALHVEVDNPARHLYKKMGFQTKYAEMRFAKEQ